MFASRVALAVITAVVLLTGCGGPGYRDLHQELKAAGCAMPESQYQQLPDRVVLSISVVGCAGSDGYGGSRLLMSGEAVAVVARTAWTGPSYRFDTLVVTDYSGAAVDGVNGSPSTKEIPWEALAAEFGRGEHDLDAPPPAAVFEDRSTVISWIVIPPFVAVVGLLLLVALVRAIRRGSISVVWILR